MNNLKRMNQFKKKDKFFYIIHKDVIKKTELVLQDYANLEPSNEGLVYWGGTITKNVMEITVVIAPKTESSWGGVSTSNVANFEFVKILNEKKIIQIAQVHSHPSNWVDHSLGDDQYAAFKINGLLSIVVPSYCKTGMLPLTKCGVHRYENGLFVRLPSSYLNSHFQFNDSITCELVDLRK